MDFILYAIWDMDLVDALRDDQDPRDALAYWGSDIEDAMRAIKDTLRHEVMVHNLGTFETFGDKGCISYKPGDTFYEVA